MAKTLWNSQDDKDFIFDETFHRYLYKGEKIISVTQLIKVLTNEDFSGIPSEILNEARDRGNAIHKEIELGVIESMEAKWIEKQITRADCKFEQRFYTTVGDFMFAGTADIVDLDTVYDIKTQAKPDMLHWTLQLNFYNQFFQRENLKILHTPKSGNYKVFDIPVLSVEKMNELINAYLQGKVIDESFINEKKELAKVPINLDLEIYQQDVGMLTTNAKDLKTRVEEALTSYNSDNYNAENIDLAKKDKAELNKSAKALSAKRIEITKAFMKPIEEFEKTIKDTEKLIKMASSKIDVLVKDVENEEKENKKNLIKSYFDSLNFDLVDFEKIFNPKWTNKTSKIESTKKEIDSIISKIESDLKVLDRLEEPEARAFYLSNLDLDSALNKADELKANRERLEEAERLKAEKAQEEQSNSESQKENNKPIDISSMEIVESEEQKAEGPNTSGSEDEVLYTVKFEVKGSESDLQKLQAFMDNENIKYTFLKG